MELPDRKPSFNEPAGEVPVRRGATAITMTLLLVGGVVGCSDDEARSLGEAPPTTVVAGMPVLKDATHGPGRDLGAGFTVVDGSILLGETFPIGVAFEYNGRPVEDRGFSASLLVTGDARRVLDAYAAQAAVIGLPLSRDNTLGICRDDDLAKAFVCTASASQGPPDHGRGVRLTLWRGAAVGDRAPLSHLYLVYSEIGEPPFEGPVDEEGTDDGPGVGNPPLPRDWPALAEVGEPYESGIAQPPLRVEPGTELVAHPSLSGTCGPSTGSTAVFRVTGDPREILVALAEQQFGGQNDASPVRKEDVDDVELLKISWTNGGSYTVTAAIRPGEPTWMLVDHCVSD